MKCGLLGRKLGHSYSPQIHSFLGNYTYSLFEKEPEEVENFLKSGDFSAINVTIPYKKTVIPYCNAISPCAERMGAINTIVRQPNGTLLGHNTDYFGFSAMIHHSGLDPKDKKVLVLGSGGASNTAVAVLEDLGAMVTVIPHADNTPENLITHQDAKIIVNATPVGMFPGNGTAPVDLSLFPELEGVLDMIYNPARTKLLLDAERRGLIAENGLWMLVAQAKEAAEWFQSKALPDSVIAEIHRNLSLEMENIVLIGMPGCGKTCIGKLLAELLNREFADTDEAIVEKDGRPIPQIFSESGEEYFRKLETEVLADFCKKSGLVISTGGGCVTRPENYPLLHQNSRVFQIQRPVSFLATEGRPLSSKNSLQAMYIARKPLYEAFANHTIRNDTNPEAAAKRIIKTLIPEAEL